MTTAVKVDAHAGWPVNVIQKEPQGVITIHRVEPYTERTFYVHGTMTLEVIEATIEGKSPRPLAAAEQEA